MRALEPISTVDPTDEHVTIDLYHPSDDLAAIGLATPSDLTDTERQVLEAVACGLSNKQIAAALDVTYHTVKTHVRHVTEKLGAANRTDAARMLVRARTA